MSIKRNVFKKNANLRQNKLSAYKRYIMFVIMAIDNAFSTIVTAVCATLVYTGVSTTWETKMYIVMYAAIAIGSAAMACRIGASLRNDLIIFDQFRASRSENLNLDQE